MTRCLSQKLETLSFPGDFQLLLLLIAQVVSSTFIAPIIIIIIIIIIVIIIITLLSSVKSLTVTYESPFLFCSPEPGCS